MREQPDVAKGLSYPWGKGQAPEPGCWHAVADGVWWLHMPLPFALNRINLWLLEDGDGWTLVDCGLATAESREVWDGVVDGLLGERPVKRIIVTHMHPDHIGLAGWLCERFGCGLWMSRNEFLSCRNLLRDTGQPAPATAVDFYRAAGFDAEKLAGYQKRFGQFGAHVEPLPDSYHRLKDGQTIEIGGRYWQIVVGQGHSPEHVCLFCPALKLLISGDQVIPRISSNVSLFPTEPDNDPLAEWLAACHRIRGLIPNDVLVLPAHQEPFHGLHVRLTQLLRSQEKAMERLFEFLEQPRRAVDCFSVLFRRPVAKMELMLATGETLANLNCLIGRRMVGRTLDDDGVAWFARLPEAQLEPDAFRPQEE